MDVDFSRLNPNDVSDPSFQASNNVDSQVSPIIGAGLYLRNKDRWYLGLSVPNLLKTEYYDDNAVSSATELMHLYLIGGYVFDLNPDWKFKPAFMLKEVSGSPLSADVSANFMYSEQFTLGAAYRWDSGISGLLGFQVNKNVMIGYAYDYELTDISDYSHGSHELFLRFELGGANNKGVVNPRFF